MAEVCHPQLCIDGNIYTMQAAQVSTQAMLITFVTNEQNLTETCHYINSRQPESKKILPNFSLITNLQCQIDFAGLVVLGKMRPFSKF